ncbi:MAG: hypothetical protein AB1439_10850 [candidate division FCPU426 bacterium]
MKLNSTDIKYWEILFWGLVLLSLKTYAVPVTPGLDPSWNLGMNLISAYGIQCGKEVFFNYGPLFPLINLLPVNPIYETWVIITCLIQGIFFYSIWSLVKNNDAKTREYTVGGIIFLLLISSSVGIENILVFTPIICLLNYHENDKARWLWIAAGVTSISALTKTIPGLCGFGAVVLYSIYRIITDRNGSWKIGIFGTILIYLTMWLLIYRDFGGVIGYWKGALELSSGFSTAMALYSNNDWVFLGLFVLSLVVMPWLLKNSKIWLLFLLASPMIFYEWKHGIVRQCAPSIASAIVFMYTFTLFIAIYYFVQKRRVTCKLTVILLPLIFLSVFYQRTYHESWLTVLQYSIFQPIHQMQRHLLINWPNKSKTLKESRRNVERYAVDKIVRDKIGSETVDCYPWEVTYIFANDFKWKPRPVFQAYTTYTPWLQKQNAEYHRSKTSARYLLWHYDHEDEPFISGKGLVEIDNKYLLNTEPAALYQIISIYSPVYQSERLILFEKSEENSIRRVIENNKYEAKWGEWIAVSTNPGEIIRAQINVKRHLIGQIRKFLYKDGDCHIYYKTDENEEIKYRLNILNASEGIWVSPLINKMDKPNDGRHIKEIKLVKSPNTYFEDLYSIRWERIIIQKRDL